MAGTCGLLPTTSTDITLPLKPMESIESLKLRHAEVQERRYSLESDARYCEEEEEQLERKIREAERELFFKQNPTACRDCRGSGSRYGMGESYLCGTCFGTGTRHPKPQFMNGFYKLKAGTVCELDLYNLQGYQWDHRKGRVPLRDLPPTIKLVHDVYCWLGGWNHSYQYVTCMTSLWYPERVTLYKERTTQKLNCGLIVPLDSVSAPLEEVKPSDLRAQLYEVIAFNDDVEASYERNGIEHIERLLNMCLEGNHVLIFDDPSQKWARRRSKPTYHDNDDYLLSTEIVLDGKRFKCKLLNGRVKKLFGSFSNLFANNYYDPRWDKSFARMVCEFGPGLVLNPNHKLAPRAIPFSDNQFGQVYPLTDLAKYMELVK